MKKIESEKLIIENRGIYLTQPQSLADLKGTIGCIQIADFNNSLLAWLNQVNTHNRESDYLGHMIL
jgi:hypothetical protein